MPLWEAILCVELPKIVDALCLEETGAEQVAKPANKTARTTKRKPKAAPGESSKSEAGASKKGRAGVK